MNKSYRLVKRMSTPEIESEVKFPSTGVSPKRYDALESAARAVLIEWDRRNMEHNSQLHEAIEQLRKAI